MDILTPDPTSVYRYYDQDHVLLYVGITRRGTQRQREHNAGKEWWPHVRRQAVDHYATRHEALRREKALIQKYCPPFNKQHNPGYATTRAAYLQRAALLQDDAFRAALNAQGLSQRARQILSVIEHRLPLKRCFSNGSSIVYETAVKHWKLAREVQWEPGPILRNPTQIARLVRVQVDEGAEKCFLIFERTKAGGKVPPIAVLKLRTQKHPILAKPYEAVA